MTLKLGQFASLKRMDGAFKLQRKWDDASIREAVNNPKSYSMEDIPKLNPSYLSMWLNWLKPLVFGQRSVDLIDLVPKFEKETGISVVNKSPFAENAVLLTDPSMCKTMYLFGVHPRTPIRGAIVAREYYFKSRNATALSTSHGEEWRKARSSIAPLLLESHITRYYSQTVNDVADEFLALTEFVRDKTTCELPGSYYDLVQRWCLETLGQVTLNYSFGCLSTNLNPDSIGYQMHTTHLRLFEQMNNLEDKTMWKYWPTVARNRFYKDMDFIMNNVQRFVENAKSMESKFRSANVEKAVVHFLLDAGTDVATTTSLIVDLLSGGIETVANIIVVTLYALAVNPMCQEKLKHELDSIALKNANLHHEGKYLRACIREAMRLLPVVPANTRTLQEDTQIGQYNIPSGTAIVAAHGVIGLMARYFENPLQYRPERWLSDEKPHPFATLPFGHGARICVAKRLAEEIMEVLLAKLIQEYQFSWSGEPIRMKYQLHRQVQPPLRFTCVKRSETKYMV